MGLRLSGESRTNNDGKGSSVAWDWLTLYFELDTWRSSLWRGASRCIWNSWKICTLAKNSQGETRKIVWLSRLYFFFFFCLGLGGREGLGMGFGGGGKGRGLEVRWLWLADRLRFRLDISCRPDTAQFAFNYEMVCSKRKERERGKGKKKRGKTMDGSTTTQQRCTPTHTAV